MKHRGLSPMVCSARIAFIDVCSSREIIPTYRPDNGDIGTNSGRRHTAILCVASKVIVDCAIRGADFRYPLPPGDTGGDGEKLSAGYVCPGKARTAPNVEAEAQLRGRRHYSVRHIEAHGTVRDHILLATRIPRRLPCSANHQLPKTGSDDFVDYCWHQRLGLLRGIQTELGKRA